MTDQSRGKLVAEGRLEWRRQEERLPHVPGRLCTHCRAENPRQWTDPPMGEDDIRARLMTWREQLANHLEYIDAVLAGKPVAGARVAYPVGDSPMTNTYGVVDPWEADLHLRQIYDRDGAEAFSGATYFGHFAMALHSFINENAAAAAGRKAATWLYASLSTGVWPIRVTLRPARDGQLLLQFTVKTQRVKGTRGPELLTINCGLQFEYSIHQQTLRLAATIAQQICQHICTAVRGERGSTYVPFWPDVNYYNGAEEEEEVQG